MSRHTLSLARARVFLHLCPHQGNLEYKWHESVFDTVRSVLSLVATPLCSLACLIMTYLTTVLQGTIPNLQHPIFCTGAWQRVAKHCPFRPDDATAEKHGALWETSLHHVDANISGTLPNDQVITYQILQTLFDRVGTSKSVVHQPTITPKVLISRFTKSWFWKYVWKSHDLVSISGQMSESPV